MSTKLAIIILTLFAAQTTYANQSTPSSEIKKDKIDLLKEKIASKVAELDKTIKFANEGTVTKIEEGLLIISTESEDKTINTNDNTKFLIRSDKLTESTGKFTTFKKNDLVTIIGSEQLGTDIVNASLIVKAPDVVFFSGTVKKINKSKFTFEIIEEGVEKELEYSFDYEKHTRTTSLDNEKLNFNSAGFTDLKENAQVRILALPQSNSETNFTAIRIILIP